MMFGYIISFTCGVAVGGGLIIANQRCVKRAADSAKKQAIYECEERRREQNAAYRRGVCDRKEGRRERWDGYDG